MSPSRSGALASRASALGRLVTWSSRSALAMSAAWLNRFNVCGVELVEFVHVAED